MSAEKPENDVSTSRWRRRSFLKTSLAAGAATLAPWAIAQTPPAAGKYRIAPFRFDVTPPLGHPLCGGWIKPAIGTDDSLECIGYILLGSGAPVVVCAVDWTGILNEAHVRWRAALAQAAGTTPDRVAVHCVHQHNAPFACPTTQRLLDAQPGGLVSLNLEFLQRCLTCGTDAVRAALPHARAVTRIAFSQARVDRIASNRRVQRDPAGNVLKMRGSSSKDPELIALPEGKIDPDLRTIAFFDGDRKLVNCHYYTTHPMSYYGDGRVTSDFVGLARKRRQQETPDCIQIYFTGCAGNISAGKYNDGSPQMRVILTERIYAAMVASDAKQVPEPLATVEWRTESVRLTPRPEFDPSQLRGLLENEKESPAVRIRSAMKLAWIDRCEQGPPLFLSSLHLNRIAALHLPAEMFLEYQLRAQTWAAGRQLATAAYGDGGPWYIPIAEEFPFGGYEVDFAFCGKSVDAILSKAIRSLVV